jgi:hypothetical protein
VIGVRNPLPKLGRDRSSAAQGRKSARGKLKDMSLRAKTPAKYGKLAAGVFICSFVLAFSLRAATAQEGWSILGVGSKGILFYDPGRIGELGAGKKKVWMKFVYNREGVASLKSLGERFAAAAYLTIPYEINCPERHATCQEGIIYSREDEPLGPFQCSGGGTKGEIIFPESVSEEALLDKVCP